MVGFEGMYEVSNTGLISSSKWGKRRVLKKKINTSGYEAVSMYKDGKQYTLRVNRCVALCFIPTNDVSLFVNHINSDKIDNRVENLEWVTHRENMEHKYGHTLNRRKFTIDEINKMYELHKTGNSIIKICKYFNFRNKTAIHCLLAHFHPEY